MNKQSLLFSTITERYGIDFKIVDQKFGDNLDYTYIDGLIGKKKIYTSLDKKRLTICIPSFFNFETNGKVIPFKISNDISKMFKTHMDQFTLIEKEMLTFKSNKKSYGQSSFKKSLYAYEKNEITITLFFNDMFEIINEEVLFISQLKNPLYCFFLNDDCIGKKHFEIITKFNNEVLDEDKSTNILVNNDKINSIIKKYLNKNNVDVEEDDIKKNFKYYYNIVNMLTI